jgi:hypothetical protein
MKSNFLVISCSPMYIELFDCSDESATRFVISHNSVDSNSDMCAAKKCGREKQRNTPNDSVQTAIESRRPEHLTVIPDDRGTSQKR